MAQPPGDECLNCGHRVEKLFCTRCGQRHVAQGASLWQILRELAAETFELDGRVVRTLVPFLFQPGRLTREYLAGRRASYTTPFRLFLAMTVLWGVVGFAVAQSTDFEAEVAADAAQATEADDESEPRLALTVDEDSPRWAKRLRSRFDELQSMPDAEQAEVMLELALDAVPRLIIVFLPFFALLLKLLYARTGRVYVEHFVFALHVHAFGFLLITVAVVVDQVWFSRGVLSTFALYLFIAMHQAYAARWWTTTLRFVALAVVYIPLLGLSVDAFMVLGLAL